MIPHPSKDGHTPSSNAATPSEGLESSNYDQSRPGSPERPPVSPITPTASLAQLAPPTNPVEHILPPQASTFIAQPSPVPISESENPDAIALRSAISLLQLQREKSKRDIRALEELKISAAADPEGFVRELQARQRPSDKRNVDILAATLSDITDRVPRQILDIENGEGDNRERRDSGNMGPSPMAGDSSKFASIPQPQNIIRCPPVNWAKYHIVGDSLDKLHEEQRQKPSPGEPARDQRHAIAAPYSPFMDRTGDLHPMQTRRGSKKPAP